MQRKEKSAFLWEGSTDSMREEFESYGCISGLMDKDNPFYYKAIGCIRLTKGLYPQKASTKR